ncbi:MAG: D-lyxose/D-mannose family sugar isomerase [Thermodesulfobacteriota bacterium]
MITRTEMERARRKASELIREAGIPITEKEAGSIEVVDFGLSDLNKEGVQVLTLVQTERISVKVLVLFPDQTEPEHWHPRVGNDPGKEETVRILSGCVNFYISGINTLSQGSIPKGKEHLYTMRHERVMNPGDQITVAPGEKHWFQSLKKSAVMYSFSTVARDASDQFTDPDIRRITQICDD